MRSKTYLIVGLGEVLWDLLPTGRQLGGAPANFAHAAALLNDQGTIASRIGSDVPGDDLISKLAELSIAASYIQRDPMHPTGSVTVSLDHNGQADFHIVESVAWDFLEWTPAWRTLAQRADAVCFGSLAQRSSQSRNTIRRFLETVSNRSVRVFDVNLRQSFYSADIIHESLTLANIAKLNHDELPIVAGLLGIETRDEKVTARILREKYNLDLMCVTRGPSGSLLLDKKQADDHPGFKVRVADTIGAGDAFTAGLIHEYLREAPMKKINDLANRMGAWASTQTGAMATPSQDITSILGKL